ncbi:MAG: hypothetical protein QM820_56900 [Minicystis sp.]
MPARSRRTSCKAGSSTSIAHVAARIDEAFPGDEDVWAYVETILNSVNGHIAWYCESHRYGRVVCAATAVEREAKAA